MPWSGKSACENRARVSHFFYRPATFILADVSRTAQIELYFPLWELAKKTRVLVRELAIHFPRTLIVPFTHCLYAALSNPRFTASANEKKGKKNSNNKKKKSDEKK